ncbi:MAG: hypothetical protein KC657_34595 [Myxococcales bacterium]|nr:hypothetical protein [Myxococcales bacterium]
MAPSEQLPGSSPFRTKGVAYQGLFESFDARVPGGARGAIALLPRETQTFFDQPFLAGSMYDILPLLELSRQGALLCDVSWREFVREGARRQADRDTRGVYRFMLRVASPKLVVERLPRVMVQYFDFGDVSGEHDPEGRLRYEASVRDLPEPVAPWLSAVGEGFIPVVMERAGARDVSVLVHPSRPCGVRAGVRLLEARFAVKWAAR